MDLEVFITLPDSQTDIAHVGSLLFGPVAPSGKYSTTFSLSREWGGHKDFFPLDPEMGKAKSFSVQGLASPLAVFRDQMPDDWGMRILVKEHALSGAMISAPNILRIIGSRGLGALSFVSRDGKSMSSARDAAVKHLHGESVLDLELLIKAAEDFNRGLPVTPEMRRLFAVASSSGGARPKAIINNEGKSCIAKFSKEDDSFDVAGLEKTAMDLASLAGLTVPRTTLARMPGRSALLVERFDITPEGGRRHLISLSTLCRESGGLYVNTYREVLDAVRRYSSAPDADARLFFRQMAFNFAIGNTDDHLRNFLMVHDYNGFRLSPGFDILPDIAGKGEHVLLAGMTARPSMQDLRSLGDAWGIGNAGEIVDEVIFACERFADTAKSNGVPENEIEHFRSGIDGRCKVATGLALKMPRPR